MTRRWLLPLLTGLAVTLFAYYATLLATPRVLMSAAIKRVAAGGVNHMTHGPLATDQARTIVRPSPDLAYSSCPYDVSAGPVAIHVAPVPAPYWSLSVFDARTDVAFVRNNGQSGGKPIDLIVARLDQSVPAGRDVVRVEGSKGIALVRILVEDRSRFREIDAARRVSSCRPL